MTRHGMGDEATIDEVIEDIDTDKVFIFSWILILYFSPFPLYFDLVLFYWHTIY